MNRIEQPKVLQETITRNMLNKIRSCKLNESEEFNNPPLQQETLQTDNETYSDISIPINDSTFPGILEQEKEKLMQKLPNVKFEDNCFMYNPSNNTVSITGIIQNMNNLRFYFTTDSSSPEGGCYIFVQGLVLTQSALQTLSIIKGHYDIFVKEWSANEVSKKLNIKSDEVKKLQQQYSNENYFKLQ